MDLQPITLMPVPQCRVNSNSYTTWQWQHDYSGLHCTGVVPTVVGKKQDGGNTIWLLK